MLNKQPACRGLKSLALCGATFLICIASLSARAADSWKEEVLLHDGQKIIVERSQTYGGRHEIGQPSSVREHIISFVLPGSGKRLTWVSEVGPGGMTNFNPAALHIKDGTPYLVVVPNLCLSYNKWGRPNPPYVIFKYENTAWQRVPLTELPPEFVDVNVVIDSFGRSQFLAKQSLVPIKVVRQLNDELTQPEYKTILREPVNYDPECIPMVTNGKGLWLSKGWFSSKPTLEACLVGCQRENFGEKTCPCNKLFEGK